MKIIMRKLDTDDIIVIRGEEKDKVVYSYPDSDGVLDFVQNMLLEAHRIKSFDYDRINTLANYLKMSPNDERFKEYYKHTMSACRRINDALMEASFDFEIDRID